MKTEPGDVDQTEDAIAPLRRPPAPEPTAKDLARQRVGAFYRRQRGPITTARVVVGAELRQRRIRTFWRFAMYGTLIIVIPIVGIGVFQRVDARRTIERAEAGDIAAAIRAAHLYSAGVGVDENRQESARWYLVAATAGDPGAQERVARNYRRGREGYPKDRDEAIRWYLASADQGWGQSMIDVSEMYAENPDDLDGLADSYMWLWLKFAAGSVRFEDDVYHEGIIEGSGGYGASSDLHGPVYDALGEDAKADAKQRAMEWRPVPTTRMELTPGLEPRWWTAPTDDSEEKIR